MMTSQWLVVALAGMLLGGPIYAGTGESPPDPGTKALGQLIGRWSVEMEVRDGEGNWNPQPGEREWRWYYILDGQAIQDDFITWRFDPDGQETGREIGTNIRIYNAQEKQWHMAWIHSARRRLATFLAVNEGDSVVMTGVNDQGREVRNTFFDVQADHFQWVQEWTFDEGATWVPVARIRARRIE